MTFSFKRVNAIFIKDWKDLLRNSYVLFTLAIPLVFAAWLGRMSGEESAVFSTYPINLALIIAGAFIQAAMVAEEKEKHTLRGLLLSPASTAEVFVGKSALSAAMGVAVVIGSIFLSEYKVPSPLLFTVSVLLGLVFYIAIGTILGLLSRTVMETSIIGMPVLIIFGMSSMVKTMVENTTIVTLIDYLPNEQLNAIMENLLVLCVWAASSIVLTIIIYQKRRID